MKLEKNAWLYIITKTLHCDAEELINVVLKFPISIQCDHLFQLSYYFVAKYKDVMSII